MMSPEDRTNSKDSVSSFIGHSLSPISDGLQLQASQLYKLYNLIYLTYNNLSFLD